MSERCVKMNNFVSVVMPVYNEEKYIKNCVESLLTQDYPKENMEWIFVDGCSTDKTKEFLEEYKEKYPELIKIINNPHKVVTYAMNIGIENSVGKYIIRLDAHAEYDSDYISKCVHYLDTTDADNVGGVAETKSEGFLGNGIAKMMSSKFGVGNSQFRTEGESGYVDTVPFGAFRREVFEKVGMFNPKLLRSEDNDINARIREAGGKVWLAKDIKFIYHCRDTIKGILKMSLQNGNALFFTLKENPKAMSIRHFIPFVFLMSLIIMPIISIIFPMFWWLFAVEMGLYFLLDAYFSFCTKEPKYGLMTFWLSPLFHIVYGIGSLLSLFGIALY